MEVLVIEGTHIKLNTTKIKETVGINEDEPEEGKDNSVQQKQKKQGVKTKTKKFREQLEAYLEVHSHKRSQKHSRDNCQIIDKLMNVTLIRSTAYGHHLQGEE